MYSFILKVDGMWADWSEWSSCNVTCEGGIRIKHRTCTNPHPKFGGLPCVGSDSVTSVCNDNPCPSTLLDLLLISIQDKLYLFGFHF